MTSLERMVSQLKARGVLDSEALEKAFLRVDRRTFILREEAGLAYGIILCPSAGDRQSASPIRWLLC